MSGNWTSWLIMLILVAYMIYSVFHTVQVYSRHRKALTEWKKTNADAELFDDSKIYYEQLVRILYYFVIYMNIQDYKQLYNNLRYLFSDDKDDKYNDLHMLENLIELYKIIINNIPNLNKIYRNKEYIDVSIDVFIDKWNNTDMHNKLNIIELRNKARNRITYVIDKFDEIAVQYYLDEDESIILKFFKDFLIDLRSNKFN